MSFKFMRQCFVLLVFSLLFVTLLVAVECVAEEKRPVWTPAEGLEGILNTGGDVEQKTMYIKEYLGKKYLSSGKGQKGVTVTLMRYDHFGGKVLRSIGEISFDADFTPPGFLPEGETDDDMRMLARAFLEEEKELFGLANLDEDVRISDGIGMFQSGADFHYEALFRVLYKRYVEGIELRGRREIFFGFIFQNGKPRSFQSLLVPVSPEMVESAKRFNEVGITKAAAKKAIKAEADSHNFAEGFKGDVSKIDCWITAESPYVVWYGIYGMTGVTLNAFTGEVLRWDPLVIEN